MGEFIQEIIDRLAAQFDPKTLGASLGTLLTNLIVALATFVIFFIGWWLLDKVLGIFLKRAKVNKTTETFIKTALQYTLLTIGAIQALASVGIDTGALFASLGIAGLTIGFAARDALSNLISGLLIFWDRPFVIGDLIEVEGHYGVVDNITLRSTRVVTIDGKMLAVPNSVIINTTVASYTNFPNLRLDVNVTISVNEDIDNARAIILKVASESAGILPEPAPKVVVTALNDYNVALQLQAWLDEERDHIPKRFEIRERIFKALTAAGVDMPYETFRLEPFEVHTKQS